MMCFVEVLQGGKTGLTTFQAMLLTLYNLCAMVQLQNRAEMQYVSTLPMEQW